MLFNKNYKKKSNSSIFNNFCLFYYGFRDPCFWPKWIAEKVHEKFDFAWPANTIKQTVLIEKWSIWDPEKWRICIRSNEIASFLKTRLCTFWVSFRGSIFIKNQNSANAIKTNEILSKRYILHPQNNEIIEISKDLWHFSTTRFPPLQGVRRICPLALRFSSCVTPREWPCVSQVV